MTTTFPSRTSSSLVQALSGISSPRHDHADGTISLIATDSSLMMRCEIDHLPSICKVSVNVPPGRCKSIASYDVNQRLGHDPRMFDIPWPDMIMRS